MTVNLYKIPKTDNHWKNYQIEFRKPSYSYDAFSVSINNSREPVYGECSALLGYRLNETELLTDIFPVQDIYTKLKKWVGCEFIIFINDKEYTFLINGRFVGINGNAEVRFIQQKHLKCYVVNKGKKRFVLLPQEGNAINKQN